MIYKQLFTSLGKLILVGLIFIAGIIAGGVVVSVLGLQAPQMPGGADVTTVMLYYLIEGPVLALALALISRSIEGSLFSRAIILSFLTWVAYALNTALDASVFVTTSSLSFTAIIFLVPSLFVGIAIAFLFPSSGEKRSFITISKEFFSHRSTKSWIWRLTAAAVAFTPVYIIFGLIVYPFTINYYTLNMYGLKAAGWDQILPILFIRSLLFFAACLPVIILWQKSKQSLFLGLGFVLFVLVGLLYILAAYWMPAAVRIPHSLEILADSFVYAGILVALLARSINTAKTI